jgi:hypothetical protein
LSVRPDGTLCPSPRLANYVAHAHPAKFSLTLMSEMICKLPSLDFA